MQIALTSTHRGGDMPEYDWRKVAVNQWSVKIDTTGAIDHLAFSADVMHWFRDEGQTMLKSACPLSDEAWRELLANGFSLLRDFHATKSVALLFVAVVERGIADLAAFVSSNDCRNDIASHSNQKTPRKIATEWFQTIAYQIQPGARLGINGDMDAALCDTRGMILRLVPIAQDLRTMWFLQQLARSYHPGDELGQQLFIAHFKNWAENEE